MSGDACRPAGAGLRLEAVHEVDGVVEPDPGAGAHAGPAESDGEMGLAGAGAADQHAVALGLKEAAGAQLAHQVLAARRAGAIEVRQLLGQRQLGRDRKRGVQGKSLSVSVEQGGRDYTKKKKPR